MGQQLMPTVHGSTLDDPGSSVLDHGSTVDDLAYFGLNISTGWHVILNMLKCFLIIVMGITMWNLTIESSQNGH